jgi:hypothetical protein
MKKVFICLIAGLTCFAVISSKPSPTAADSSNDDETDPFHKKYQSWIRTFALTWTCFSFRQRAAG